MAENQLFKRLCSRQVMTPGWHLAQADSRDDFVTDPVGNADFASNLDARLKYVIEQVKTDRYRPRHLIDIDLPKTGLSVRPGNVLPIEEAVLLHGITYLLAPPLDRHLSKASVYSFRLHPDWEKRVKKGESMFREAEAAFPFLKRRTVRSISPFEAWYDLWPEFEAEATKAVTNEGYTHLTKTDITAYFENIDLGLLDSIIRERLHHEGKILQVLYRILDGWTRTTSTGQSIGRGIPQGNDVSSFLGNVYLIPLDIALTHFCKKHEAKWFRYVDDVKVFSRSEQVARQAVFVVNSALRALHLNLQGSKTEILSGEALARELDESELHLVDDVFGKIRKVNRAQKGFVSKVVSELKPLTKLAGRFRRKIMKDVGVTGLGGKESRTFRRLLTVYGSARRPYFREAAIAAMRQLPDLRILRRGLGYLSQLSYSTHSSSVEAVLKLVETDALPFPYQVGLTIETIGRMHPEKPKPIASRIRGYALSKKCHWFVCQKAIETIATYPYNAKNCEKIALKHLSHEHPLVRRAACVLLVRGRKHVVREQLRQLTFHADPAVVRLAAYFLRLADDPEFADSQLARMRHGSSSDYAQQQRLTTLYGIAATQDKQSAKNLSVYLASLSSPESERVAWHMDHLAQKVSWAAASPPAPGSS